MASIQAVAIKRALAAERLAASMKLLGEELGIAPITLPTQGRDQAAVHAAQLDSMADYLEGVVKALHPVEDAQTVDVPAMSEEEFAEELREINANALPKAFAEMFGTSVGEPVSDEDAANEPPAEVETVSPYADLTRKELQALVDERQLTVTGTGANGNVLVEDLRGALSASDAEAKG
jgi:hypothetical protein